MNDVIRDIVTIIGDYRNDDIGLFYNTILNEEHIRKWVNQFDENDREFLLSELLHLLPNSYLTKDTTLEIISTEFDILSKAYGYENINNFFEESIFLDCQANGKSQKILLDLIDGVLHTKYSLSINQCGNKSSNNWIYTDDVLASGGTFRDEIWTQIEKFGIDEFKNSSINIICSFVILHDWAVKNVRYALDQKLGKKLGNRLKFFSVAKIENYPIVNYYNPSPKFNHIYPIKSDLGTDILDFVEENSKGDYEFRNENHAFRNPDFPKVESFFTSKENRNRYEQILMSKGFDIIQSIDNLTAKSLRPLGMTNPTNKTLGSGTHFFTWRNISNTCPIVFWWGANDWYPLFPVKLRGNNVL